MLRIYFVMLDVLRNSRGAIATIEKHDSDLARQMRRAGTSVTLNLAEGSGSTGGVRRVRYRTALGSAREVRACLESAEALGYLGGIDAGVSAGLTHVINVLVRLVA
jgi:four helix bundle protein